MSDTDAIAWWGGFTAGAIAAWIGFCALVIAVWLFLWLLTRREDRRAAQTAAAEQTDPAPAAAPEPDHADWTSADWAAAAPAPLTTTGWDAAAHRALTTPAPGPATPPAAEPDSRPRHLAPDLGTPPERTHAFPRYRLRDRPTQPATP